MNWLTMWRWLLRTAGCKHRRWNDVVRGDGLSYRVCSDCGSIL